MRKKSPVILTTLLAVSLLAGCGGSAPSEKTASSDSGKKSEKAEKPEKVDVTWSWGTLRGLYGDAEVTFNEDGGRETIVMKYPNGSTYRQIEYDYTNNYVASVDATPAAGYLSGKKVYPSAKITKNENGIPIYRYGYDWLPCEEKIEYWGAGIASDITPILKAGEQKAEGKLNPEDFGERYYSYYEYGNNLEESDFTGSLTYQEMSHTILSGTYLDICNYGKGYWLTMRENGNPAKTWFYAPDGRLDEDLTITWNYEKDKPVSLQLGPSSMHTYMAEESEDGSTCTYTLDESYETEAESEDGKEPETRNLERLYSFTFTYDENGKPSVFQYNSSAEYLNTEGAEKTEFKLTYTHENNVLSKAEYQVSQTNRQPMTYTITCNEKGMLKDEDYLAQSIGGGDIGAKSYTYYDDGKLESVTGYNDFTPNPEDIEYVRQYNEDGSLRN